jgi:hypothetical protein
MCVKGADKHEHCGVNKAAACSQRANLGGETGKDANHKAWLLCTEMRNAPG